MAGIDRRSLLLRMSVGALGVAGAAAGLPGMAAHAESPRPGRSSPGRSGPGRSGSGDGTHQVYKGRTITILPPPAGGIGFGRTRIAPHVLIDTDPLDVMLNADGSYSSVLNHFEKYHSITGIARAAVDALAGARLVPAPPAARNRTGIGAPPRPPVPSRAAAAARVRHNQRDLTKAQRAAFVNALLAVKSNGTYDDLVRTHNTFAASDAGGADGRYAHRCPSFLPWHRRLLLDLEDALRAVDPSVTIPYWDWTVDRRPTGAPWTDDLLGGTGRAGDRQVTTGPFAYRTGNWPITVRLDSRPYLTRALGVSPLARSLPTASTVRRALATTPYDTAPWNDDAGTAGFRNLLEGWAGARPMLHNQVHVWVGGNMDTTASPNDPAFWLHHCFIDRLWASWQAANPGAGYLPDTSAPHVVDIDEPMQPWGDVTPRDMLDHTRFYTYA
jgi:tyrosinase